MATIGYGLNFKVRFLLVSYSAIADLGSIAQDVSLQPQPDIAHQWIKKSQSIDALLLYGQSNWNAQQLAAL